MIGITAALRTRWAAVGAAVAVTLGAVGLGGLNIASADISEGDRPVFVPMNPCRLVDTRPGSTVGTKSSPLGPNEVLTLTARGSNGQCTGPSTIPADAVGLSLNVTALGQTERTFLTIWGEGDDPGTSNLNPEPGQPPTPNAVTTPLSATGTFNVRNNAGNVNALIDVVGYYANHNHDDRYEQQRTLKVVDGLALRPLDPTSEWTFDVQWEHAISAASECLAADIDLPIGARVTAAELHYSADSALEVSISLSQQPSGVEAVTGPPATSFAKFSGDLPAVPATEIGIQPLSISFGEPATLLGYSQTLRICTTDTVMVGSVRLTYTNP